MTPVPSPDEVPAANESYRENDGLAQTPAPNVIPMATGRAYNEPAQDLHRENPLPMFVLSTESFSFVDVNPAVLRVFGFSLSTLKRHGLAKVFPYLDDEVLQGGSFRTRARHHDGTESSVELHTNLALYRGRPALFAVVVPIESYTQADERADLLQTFLKNAQVAMLVINPEGLIQFWNERAATLYGWTEEDVLGRSAGNLLGTTEETIAAAWQAVIDHGEWSGELRRITKNGQPVSVISRWTPVFRVNGSLHSILIIDIDITAQKDLEAQYLRSQRLESIGTLASGIAHDLNNILTPILMSVGILRARTHDPESQKLLQAIEGSADRGAGIVRQVLTFARGVAGDKMLLQPRHLVNELVKILSQTFPKNISVRNQMPRDLWMVMGDATQIHQVLLNLCLNARDAMPNGGSLFLLADNVLLDRNATDLSPYAKQGPYVVLQVTDTGSGITDEVAQRMFDPFFTTKDPGKGTGLGLSTAQGIVKNHGGFMTMETEVGKGTTFKAFLPASPGSELQAANTQRGTVPRGNNELILVVDDEAAVRASSVRTLEGHGYRVFTAEDGSDALALYFQKRSEIALVLTDLTMEQMDGLQLAQALRRLDPNVRIIVSSGQCGEDRAAAFRGLGVDHFLDKPYKPEQLLTVVHETLHPNLGKARR